MCQGRVGKQSSVLVLAAILYKRSTSFAHFVECEASYSIKLYFINRKTVHIQHSIMSVFMGKAPQCRQLIAASAVMFYKCSIMFYRKAAQCSKCSYVPNIGGDCQHQLDAFMVTSNKETTTMGWHQVELASCNTWFSNINKSL